MQRNQFIIRCKRRWSQMRDQTLKCVCIDLAIVSSYETDNQLEKRNSKENDHYFFYGKNPLVGSFIRTKNRLVTSSSYFYESSEFLSSLRVWPSHLHLCSEDASHLATVFTANRNFRAVRAHLVPIFCVSEQFPFLSQQSEMHIHRTLSGGCVSNGSKRAPRSQVLSSISFDSLMYDGCIFTRAWIFQMQIATSCVRVRSNTHENLLQRGHLFWTTNVCKSGCESNGIILELAVRKESHLE